MSTKSLFGCGTRGGEVKDKIDLLIKEMKNKSWEIEIIDFLLGAALTDEVLKTKSVQKLAGQHSWFKGIAGIRNYNSNIGLGAANCTKEITTVNQVANSLAYFFFLSSLFRETTVGIRLSSSTLFHVR